MSIFTQKGDLHAKDYLGVLQRRWAVMVLSFVLCVGASFYVNKMTPELYEASTRLIINPDLGQSILGGQVNPYVADLNEDLSINTNLFVIRSEPIAEGVVRRLPNFPNEKSDPEAFREFTRRVKRVLSVDRIPGTRIFNINAASGKGQEAADIANASAEVFIESSMKNKFDATRRSIGWLTDQIIEVQTKLEASEKALLEYQKEAKFTNLGINPEFQAQKMGSLQMQYLETQNEKSELQNKLLKIKKYLDSSDSKLVPRGITPKIDQLSEEISDLNIDLDKAKLEYKEKHPKVIGIMENINIYENKIRSELRKEQDQINSELQVITAKETFLQTALNSATENTLETSEKEIKSNILRREVETYRELYDMLIKKLRTADLLSGVGESNYRIIEYAKNPLVPVRPRRMVNYAFGLILGLTLGIAMPFVVEYFDRTIRTPEDIEQAIGIPVLTSIPKIKHSAAMQGDRSIFLTKDNQQSTEAIAFHALRTNFRFRNSGQYPKSLLVTSSTPGEGKTTIAANLGVSFALAGLKTLIVDTDLRRPRIHKLFQKGNDIGVTNCSPANMSQAIQATDFENLFVLTSGPASEAPFELLESESIIRLFQDLKSKYDQIIFDSPPVSAVVDASILSTYTDGVIFVLNSGKLEPYFVKHAKEQLEKVNAKILGAVLNGLDLAHSKHYYSYYYRGNYGDRAKDLIQGIKDTIQRS